ncbi:MAG: xanthine dehydrogenase family protein molybdopterin-binding subunit [Hyphomicrobiaceae bacterium]
MTVDDPLVAGFRFLTDRLPDGCLHAAVHRSPHPHARILAIDTHRVEAMPGVYAVITERDVPGRTHFGITVHDQPVLCQDTVRTVGDPIVAVAAETPDIARAAAAAITVTYRELPVIADAEQALAHNALPIHEAGNLLHRTTYRNGDFDAAGSQSVHVISDIYRTPRQVHHFIEPEGAVAVPEDGRITIFAPGHWAEAERQTLAQILALDPDRVRVVASPAGGSFGGKDQLHAQPIAALLALITQRPVKLMWSRPESFAVGVKRHPFIIRMRSGCTAEGHLTFHEADFVADTGAYAQHGPEVLDTAHENAQGPYRWQAVHLQGRLAYTNNGVSGAMRGFGALQIQTALEQQIERLAHASGLEPREFRRRNLRSDDAPGQLGQSLAAPAWPRRALEAVAPLPGARREGRHLIGTGMALVEKGEGFARGGPNAAALALRLTPSGLEVHCGFSDLGQGLGSAIAVATARHLGCADSDVRVSVGDSAHMPNSGPIAASRGTGIVWRAVRAAAVGLRDEILQRAAVKLGVTPPEIEIGPGGIYLAAKRGNTPVVSFEALARSPISVIGAAPPIETDTGDGAVHALFIACAATARVSVDCVTGQVRVLSAAVYPVTGPVLSPLRVRAQLEGGASLAAGFVLTERLTAREGMFRARNFDGYFAPTIRDAFDVVCAPIEGIPQDDIGPRGIGEIATNAAAPAIANAIFRATGFVCRNLPVDPAEMLAHLRQNR